MNTKKNYIPPELIFRRVDINLLSTSDAVFMINEVEFDLESDTENSSTPFDWQL